MNKLQEQKLRKKIREIINETLSADNFFEEMDDVNPDLSGMGVEMAIDGLIEEYQNILEKQFKNDTKSLGIGRRAIKELWVTKIRKWM